MRFVITSGTGIREIVEERPDARSAREHVLRLISLKRPSIRVFDLDGQPVSLEKLGNLAKQEGDKRSLTVMAAVVTTTLAIAASSPVNAAKWCKCSGAFSSGCIEWGNCGDAPAAAFRPVRSVTDCRRSQMLLCDGSSYKLVCYSKKQ